MYDDMMQMLNKQAKLNRRVASLDYRVFSSLLITTLLIGIILMYRRGCRCFHAGWFLYREDPLSRDQSALKRFSARNPERSGVLRHIYNNAFLRKVPILKGTSVGKIALQSSFLGIILVLTKVANPDPFSNPKRFGFLATVNLPLLVVFSMKNSPLAVLGIGYEKLNFLHRFIGYIVTYLIWIHGSLMLKLAYEGQIHNNKAIYSGCLMSIMLLLLWISALPPLRKTFYKAFYALHISGYLSLFIGGFFHDPYLHIFLILSVGLHVISSGWQLLKWKKVQAILTPLPGKITKVEILGIKSGWITGQHIRLRVFGNFFQSLQAHPFTIASIVSSSDREANQIVLYIKAVGVFTTMLYARALDTNGFKNIETGRNSALSISPEHSSRIPSNVGASTRSKSHSSHSKGNYASCRSEIELAKLENSESTSGSDLALDLPANVQIGVHIEGPYGGIGWEDIHEFKDVILFAGGSGISFLLCMLSDVIESAKLNRATERALVIYTVREWEAAKYFSRILNEKINASIQSSISIDLRLFVTQKVGQRPRPSKEVKIEWRRPQLWNLLKDFLKDVRDGQGVGLGASGPPSLLDEVRNSVAKLDMETSQRVGGVKVYIEALGW
ncbi:hypothetical protein O181_033019 [Austropuccinia psidii MF-1]|uniref:FAD-binding FR-type domain-containing protein n=1 Tax=Austropuccinia psidii MF-1 TaxID=1389203 RepID=A0A9Q3CXY3_9BASI|nr:hypothetical protein [Austropuccinia psidii MF-1]